MIRADPIRVVAWNIQFGVEIDAAADLLVTHERLCDADVYLLQELDHDGAAELADRLGVGHIYASSGLHAQTGRHFGNAVLSPHPITEDDSTALPYRSRVRGQPRIVTHCRVRLGVEEVHVGSVHTEVPSLGRARRRAQFDVVASVMERSMPAPAILGGDFNTVTTWGVAAVQASCAEAGLIRVSAGSGPTLRSARQELALDHVFARGYVVEANGVVHGSPASDHRPLWVELRRVDAVPSSSSSASASASTMLGGRTSS